MTVSVTLSYLLKPIEVHEYEGVIMWTTHQL